MKKISYALLTAAIIAIIAILAVPANAGPNIYANGILTIASGSTSAVETVSLSNITGQEWGEILGWRCALQGQDRSTGTVVITCSDATNNFAVSSIAEITNGTGRSVVALAVPARTLKVQGMLNVTNGIVTKIPYCIYAK